MRIVLANTGCFGWGSSERESLMDCASALASDIALNKYSIAPSLNFSNLGHNALDRIVHVESIRPTAVYW